MADTITVKQVRSTNGCKQDHGQDHQGPRPRQDQPLRRAGRQRVRPRHDLQGQALGGRRAVRRPFCCMGRSAPQPADSGTCGILDRPGSPHTARGPGFRGVNCRLKFAGGELPAPGRLPVSERGEALWNSKTSSRLKARASPASASVVVPRRARARRPVAV